MRRQSTNLDVLRAFAVLLVFVYHILCMTRTGPAGLNDALARFGVILFFVHTSCVLMGSMESLVANSKAWIRRFYVRRIFRLYPLSIVSVLLAVALGAPMTPWDGLGHPPYTVSLLFSNLLLIQNVAAGPSIISVLWSLPVEVEMYVVLPLVFLVIRSKTWGWKMAVLWAGSAALIVAVQAEASILFPHHKVESLEFIPCFLSGAIAYRMARPARCWPSFLWVPLLLAIIAVGGYYAFFAPVFWASCLVLALAFSRIGEMMRSPFTIACHFIAKYSYGIYLTHSFALWVCFQLLGTVLKSSPLRIAGTTVITALASVGLFHLLEDPMIRLGKRLADRIGPRQLELKTAGS